MMILAFGAAGDFAGSITPALAARGARVRAFIRKPEQAELVRVTAQPKSPSATCAIGRL